MARKQSVEMERQLTMQPTSKFAIVFWGLALLSILFNVFVGVVHFSRFDRLNCIEESLIGLAESSHSWFPIGKCHLLYASGDGDWIVSAENGRCYGFGSTVSGHPVLLMVSATETGSQAYYAIEADNFLARWVTSTGRCDRIALRYNSDISVMGLDRSGKLTSVSAEEWEK